MVVVAFVLNGHIMITIHTLCIAHTHVSGNHHMNRLNLWALNPVAQAMGQMENILLIAPHPSFDFAPTTNRLLSTTM